MMMMMRGLRMNDGGLWWWPQPQVENRHSCAPRSPQERAACQLTNPPR
jgi:hypothetical protein